ncbi:hypothetical protein MIR68_007067 [Amoeboaphelidium protococcarum]|nr:hypothetical protein MIR68_007067 [Amoeboaphelidium protococcarum]
MIELPEELWDQILVYCVGSTVSVNGMLLRQLVQILLVDKQFYRLSMQSLAKWLCWYKLNIDFKIQPEYKSRFSQDSSSPDYRFNQTQQQQQQQQQQHGMQNIPIAAQMPEYRIVFSPPNSAQSHYQSKVPLQCLQYMADVKWFKYIPVDYKKNQIRVTPIVDLERYVSVCLESAFTRTAHFKYNDKDSISVNIDVKQPPGLFYVKARKDALGEFELLQEQVSRDVVVPIAEGKSKVVQMYESAYFVRVNYVYCSPRFPFPNTDREIQLSSDAQVYNRFYKDFQVLQKDFLGRYNVQTVECFQLNTRSSNIVLRCFTLYMHASESFNQIDASSMDQLCAMVYLFDGLGSNIHVTADCSDQMPTQSTQVKQDNEDAKVTPDLGKLLLKRISIMAEAQHQETQSLIDSVRRDCVLVKNEPQSSRCYLKWENAIDKLAFTIRKGQVDAGNTKAQGSESTPE